MATNHELDHFRHQARRKLVSLVWHLSNPNPDFKAAYFKADALCAELLQCTVLQEAAERRVSGDKEDADIAGIFTEGRA